MTTIVAHNSDFILVRVGNIYHEYIVEYDTIRLWRKYTGEKFEDLKKNKK